MNVKFATNILAATPSVTSTLNVTTGFNARSTSMCNTTASRSEVLRNFLLQTQWVKKSAGNPTIPASFLSVPSGVNRNLSGETCNFCRVRTRLCAFSADFRTFLAWRVCSEFPKDTPSMALCCHCRSSLIAAVGPRCEHSRPSSGSNRVGYPRDFHYGVRAPVGCHERALS